MEGGAMFCSDIATSCTYVSADGLNVTATCGAGSQICTGNSVAIFHGHQGDHVEAAWGMRRKVATCKMWASATLRSFIVT